MKTTMEMKWVLPRLAMAACAFLSLALPGSAFAQSAARPLFANVSADAQCTVDSTSKDVMVDAGLIQKDTPSSGPVVARAVFSLEQHFPHKNDWSAVANSEVIQGVDRTFPLLDAGERYDVATQSYSGVCSQVSTAANAARAVVKITVDNANKSRPGANVFTGRCISFPNPCRPQAWQPLSGVPAGGL